jgi:5-formyltetrahydrofolate cyclo-ligase
VSSIADRSELRRQLRAQRAQLDARTRLSAAETLVATLEQLPEFLVDARVAGYWAVAGEMPLHAAYASLRSREQQYFLPVVTTANDLQFAAWHAGADVQTNRYGIPEPVAAADALLGPAGLDLVLVPLLGFDRRGNRLGSGAGFYDRSFAFLRATQRPARPVLVGIGYHFQEVPQIAAKAWDVPLDFVATDRELIACSVPDASNL